MSLVPRKALRVLVIMHADFIPPDTLDGVENKEKEPWRTEYDVISTLRAMGHDVVPCGVRAELGVIQAALEQHEPHVAFNLLEEFDGYPFFDQHVVSYLELRKQKYTGCNPRGLTLAHDKALTNQVLSFHRIHVPRHVVFRRKRAVKRPRRLSFPLLVKSVSDEGSLGIAQASLVRNDEKLKERVDFIHRNNGTDAIAEEFIEGREIYISVMGNDRLQTFTPWELEITNLPEGAANIATSKMKWDAEYQKKIGLITRPAELDSHKRKEFERISKRIYRILGLSGYARLDYRIKDDGRIYMLEVNPNPQIAHNEDFADSAEHSGVAYDALLRKVINLGMSYDPAVRL